VFTVKGSQGELFSVNDSLSGSLFAVGDISGLPILETLSDQTVLVGKYPYRSVNTTDRKIINSGVGQVISTLSTASYEAAFFDYTLRSGSNARAGNIMAIMSGSQVNFTEVSTNSFGNTSNFSFGVIIAGSLIALTGSSTTDGWTVKTIVRGI
jgi:hypothetical protein